MANWTIDRVLIFLHLNLGFYSNLFFPHNPGFSGEPNLVCILADRIQEH